MTRRLIPASLVLVVLAGCGTTNRNLAQRAQRVAPAVTMPPVVTSPRDQARDEINALLDSAQDAVARGAASDYAECEVAVLQTMARWPELERDPQFAAFAGDVFDELDRLSGQLQPVPGELEPPPEPEPVAAERVAEVQAKSRENRFDLPVIVNAEVTSLIDYYTGPYRERLVNALERASKLLPYIREQLRVRSMPLDLAYLPLVESAFNTRARSRAKAQGLWQFIAGTGKLYGLRNDGIVDDRNDPFLSTRAAIGHLADLKAAFGDWELALAAYNSGPGRVEKALKRAKGATDFWEIRKFLPRETRNYVPALWAALLVAKNPTAYGLPVFEEKQECIGKLKVDGALDLEVLAERMSVDVDRLADLNPALVHRVTPVGGTYALAVPCGSEEQAKTVLASIPESERVRRIYHSVKRGDTLASLARRYHTSAGAIASANGISGRRKALRAGTTILIPKYPVTATEKPASHSASPAAKRTESAGATARPAKLVTSGHGHSSQRYVVRRGDTLYSIAKRFGTTVEQLKRRNGLGGSSIKPGDVLLMQ